MRGPPRAPSSLRMMESVHRLRLFKIGGPAMSGEGEGKERASLEGVGPAAGGSGEGGDELGALGRQNPPLVLTEALPQGPALPAVLLTALALGEGSFKAALNLWG